MNNDSNNKAIDVVVDIGDGFIKLLEKLGFKEEESQHIISTLKDNGAFDGFKIRGVGLDENGEVVVYPDTGVQNENGQYVVRIAGETLDAFKQALKNANPDLSDLDPECKAPEVKAIIEEIKNERADSSSNSPLPSPPGQIIVNDIINKDADGGIYKNGEPSQPVDVLRKKESWVTKYSDRDNNNIPDVKQGVSVTKNGPLDKIIPNGINDAFEVGSPPENTATRARDFVASGISDGIDAYSQQTEAALNKIYGDAVRAIRESGQSIEAWMADNPDSVAALQEASQVNHDAYLGWLTTNGFKGESDAPDIDTIKTVIAQGLADETPVGDRASVRAVEHVDAVRDEQLNGWNGENNVAGVNKAALADAMDQWSESVANKDSVDQNYQQYGEPGMPVDPDNTPLKNATNAIAQAAVEGAADYGNDYLEIKNRLDAMREEPASTLEKPLQSMVQAGAAAAAEYAQKDTWNGENNVAGVNKAALADAMDQWSESVDQQNAWNGSQNVNGINKEALNAQMDQWSASAEQQSVDQNYQQYGEPGMPVDPDYSPIRQAATDFVNNGIAAAADIAQNAKNNAFATVEDFDWSDPVANTTTTARNPMHSEADEAIVNQMADRKVTDATYQTFNEFTNSVDVPPPAPTWEELQEKARVDTMLKAQSEGVHSLPLNDAIGRYTGTYITNDGHVFVPTQLPDGRIMEQLPWGEQETIRQEQLQQAYQDAGYVDLGYNAGGDPNINVYAYTTDPTLAADPTVSSYNTDTVRPDGGLGAL